MDKKEARALLAAKLAEYRRLGYAALVDKIGDDECPEVTGPSGVAYQVEIQFLWDDKPNGAVRVMGAIDDGGLRALMPLCDDFIIAPDGR